MAEVSPSPQLEILVRGPEGFSFWSGPPFNNGEPSVKLEKVPCSAKLSDDGSKFMPVWHIYSDIPEYKPHRKIRIEIMENRDRPSIQFSSDEAVACRLATNEIQFYDPQDFTKGFVNRLRIPSVAALELSKAPGSHVAAFIPESKGIPDKYSDICLSERTAKSTCC